MDTINKNGEEAKSRSLRLIETINQRIPVWISEHFFKTVSDVEKLYHYESGVYRDDGETVLKWLIEAEFGGHTSNKLVADIIGKVKRRTYIDREKFNSVPVVNLLNGLLDLDTLQVLPPSPDVLTTSQIPVFYDPKATCPQISKFLQEVSQPQDLPLLEEIAGWLLWPEYKIHKAIMLLGSGRNGKGTLLRLFTAFLGRENISNVTLQDLVGDRFAKADLYGKLANIGGDIPSKDLSDTSAFRMLTGEDDNRAQEKYKPAFIFRNKAKLLFSANVLPRSPDDTYAFYSRWVILEFLNRFSPEEGTGDPDLLSKLTTPQELSGLLNLALEGLARLRANRWRFSYSKTVEDVEVMYKRNANPVLAFLLDECEPANDSYIEKGVFFNQFKKYAGRHGIRPMSMTRFGELLKDQAEIPVSDFRPWIEHGDRPRCWLGVRFKDHATECQSAQSTVSPTPIFPVNGEEKEKKKKIGYNETLDGMDCTPVGEDPGQGGEQIRDRASGREDEELKQIIADRKKRIKIVGSENGIVVTDSLPRTADGQVDYAKLIQNIDDPEERARIGKLSKERDNFLKKATLIQAESGGVLVRPGQVSMWMGRGGSKPQCSSCPVALHGDLAAAPCSPCSYLQNMHVEGVRA